MGSSIQNVNVVQTSLECLKVAKPYFHHQKPNVKQAIETCHLFLPMKRKESESKRHAQAQEASRRAAEPDAHGAPVGGNSARRGPVSSDGSTDASMV